MRSLVVLALLASVGVYAQYDSSVAMSALQYCKTAYCQDTAISGWNCGPACSFHPQFVVTNVYNNQSIDSQAFTGYDPQANLIVVAFRGSSNIDNWFNDLDFIKMTYPNAACGCEVHQGFFGEWQSYSTGVLADVASLTAQYSSAQVLITGHSLGAAVSILAAMDIISQGTTNILLYNFGEPRVGDPNFAAWAAGRLPNGKQFRVTHERDPVPHVPPMDLGFLHTPHELWYDNDGDATWTDCVDSATAEDPNCSDSEIPFGIWEHLEYLGICTECTCSSASLQRKYGSETTKRLLSRMPNGHKP